MKADTAALSPSFRAGSAAEVDAAVASRASPKAENPTAMTDRLSNAITAKAATLAFIDLANRIQGVYSINFVQFYNGPSSIATMRQLSATGQEAQSRR